MSQNDKDYFATLEEWSARKLKILSHYIDAAARILSTKGNVYYIDCFAGRGYYGKAGEISTPGSPLRAAQLAQSYIDEGRSYGLRCINIEEDKERFAELQQCTAPYQNVVTNLHGTFASNINHVLHMVGANPVICFLDPFGVEGMDWSAVKRLIQKPNATDLWLRFDAGEVRRRAGWYPWIGQRPGADKQFAILQSVYGYTNPALLYDTLENAPTSEDRMLLALEVYVGQLREAFRRAKDEGYAAHYRIGTLQEEVKYHLVYAGSSKKGFVISSNIVHDIEETYQRELEQCRQGRITITGQSNMFEALDPTPDQIREAKIKDISDRIWAKYRGRRCNRQDIHVDLITHDFGWFKATHMTGALKALQDGGKIRMANGTLGMPEVDLEFTK